MNLNAYDDTITKIDKTKTWINVKYKMLLSREIKFRKYSSLLKRFDNNTNNENYYICVSDNPPTNKNYKLSFVDSYGRFKFPLHSIWNKIKHIETNINIELVESQDNYNIYYLDI